MVVKSQLKYIKSLHQKKYRSLHRRFVVEGLKTVRALLDSGWKPEILVTTEMSVTEILGAPATVISKAQMTQISALKNPSNILGVFAIPEPRELSFSDWILVLDRVGDPGNLGTIIRLCDWFKIPHLVCSTESVDVYNPKVLQATMGSVAHVNVVYRDLSDFLKSAPLPIYGAYMDGDPVYRQDLPKAGMLVLGSEAHGISVKAGDLVQHKVGIPQSGSSTAESLNVATATAILLHEIRRPRVIQK